MGDEFSASKSGYSAAELFREGRDLTYIDFAVLDAHFTGIERSEISLRTDLGKDITLELPIIASPMDTVTNDKVCIALALHGGIGAVHFNHKKENGAPDLDAQEAEVRNTKRYQNGMIENPITVSPDMTIEQVIALGRSHAIGSSTIDNFPVTEDGSSNGRLVGLLRKQDYSQTHNTQQRVKERMKPLEKLVLGTMPLTLQEANKILWDSHIPSLPIVDREGNLRYLVTRSDIDKNELYPRATKDGNNRLRVLFAINTDNRTNTPYERLERCFGAGADGVIIDTSQGFTRYERDMIRFIKARYPAKLLIGGNISTREATHFLAEEGVDAYRNGQGPGSICTTAGAIGISRAAASGIYHCAESLQGTLVRTIADGGIKEAGDIFKAVAIGAHCTMLGNMLAGTTEGPGEVKYDPETGAQVKKYRGMGSKEANTGSMRGYSRMPQGVTGSVLYKGSLHDWLPLLYDALLSSFHVVNCRNIAELHDKLNNGTLRFAQRSMGAIGESRPHDLFKY